MTDVAADLTFRFGADFSGFTRAADTAGQKLDQLYASATRLGEQASAPLDQRLSRTSGEKLRLTSPAMSRASQAMKGEDKASGQDDDTASKQLGRLRDRLALLQTTGTAHDALAQRMRIQAEQAKLGTDATEAQRQAVAGLVVQIDAAKAAQAKSAASQDTSDEAWGFGAGLLQRGISGMVLSGSSLQDTARTALSGAMRQGLSAALTGSGPLAGLFGQDSGLFGQIRTMLGGATGMSSNFSGLYAGGGTIGAGQWGIVGEKGAEVVAGPASVTPWSKLPRMEAGGSRQTINFNVTSPDPAAFARSEAQMTALLSRAVGRGQRTL